MQQTRKETKEVEIIDRFCDICNRPAEGRKCEICQRDVCYLHGHIEYWEMGDGYEKYCISCWKVGESTRERKDRLLKIYETAIADLGEEWKRIAIEKIKGDK